MCEDFGKPAFGPQILLVTSFVVLLSMNRKGVIIAYSSTYQVSPGMASVRTLLGFRPGGRGWFFIYFPFLSV